MINLLQGQAPLRAEPVPECYVSFDRYFRRLRVKPAMRKPLLNLPKGRGFHPTLCATGEGDTPAYAVSPLRAINHGIPIHFKLYILHSSLYTLHFKNSPLKSNQRGAL